MAEKTDVIEEIDAGNVLLGWETYEFEPHERSKQWYMIAGLIVTALLVFALVSSNFLFAIIVLLASIVFLLNNLHKPHVVAVHITDSGIAFGDEFYSYDDIKDFSVIYNPPVALLYVDFHGFWRPMLRINLEQVNPNLVRESLLPFALENLDREDENLTDTIERVYKL